MRQAKDDFAVKNDCIKLASKMNQELHIALARLDSDLQKGDEIDQQVAYCFIKTLYDFMSHKAPEIVKRTMAELYPPIIQH